MDLYGTIAPWYDRVFPYDPNQKSFTLTALEKAGLRAPYNICECGCGTGALAVELAAAGHHVEASDFDQAMVQAAFRRADGASNPAFRALDMRLVDQAYKKGQFDAVLAYGNTLVHLESPSEMGRFIHAARRVLKDNGILLLQILNYSHILDDRIEALPVIDNGGVRFERYYEKAANARLNFNTRLRTPEGDTFTNSTLLYPLRKNELESLLREAGFTTISHYGEFDRSGLGGGSMVLVTEARL